MTCFVKPLTLPGFLIVLGGFLVSCGQKVVPSSTSAASATASAAVTSAEPGTTFMPENMIARDAASGLTARYTDPTAHYAHGILGDKIEAGGLLIEKAGKRYCYQLDDQYVFKDLQPRLADVNGDGQPEPVTIRSCNSQGAGVAILNWLRGSTTVADTSDTSCIYVL